MEDTRPTTCTTVVLVERDSNPTGYQLVNSHKTNRNDDPMDLVSLAQQVQKANEFVRATTGSKLTVIAEQIRFLQEQARRILEDAKQDSDLHHVACNMVKIPGNIYHLYRRTSGQRYFSLVSPQEWGASCPHQFIGSFRLEHDRSWTPFKNIEMRNEHITLIDKVLNANKPCAIQEFTTASLNTPQFPLYKSPIADESDTKFKDSETKK